MNTKEPSLAQKTMHEVMRDVAVWAVTGVCAFLSFNVWRMSVSFERVATEIKYIVKDSNEYDTRLANLAAEIKVIRQEQLNRTAQVYSAKVLEERLKIIEKDLNSRANIRWNLHDMSDWVEELRKGNPDLKIPSAKTR